MCDPECVAVSWPLARVARVDGVGPFGLDVSLASTAICAVSAHGKVIKEATAASEPEQLVRALRDLPGTVIGVGLEAGPLSQWLHHALVEAGHDAFLMETRQVRTAVQNSSTVAAG